jgi:O-antigen ligase
MYLEILFALTLPLLVGAMAQRRRATAVGFGLVLLLISQAVTLTLTRSGLLAMGSSLLVVAAVHYRSHGRDRTVAVLGVIAALVLLQFATSRSIDLLRLRFTSETTGAWYRASFDAPLDIELRTAGRALVPVRITNDGRSAWSSDGTEQYFLSYHWLLTDEDRVVSWEGLRTSFPDVVAPGESVTIPALVEAPPEPGEYRLMWDIEQRHRLWFSTEPDAQLSVTYATVTGAPIAGRSNQPLLPLPKASVRPGRLVLWGAALRMFAAHPVTGVGPDNFRFVYGRYAGLAQFDQRVHSNNMYLEILAGGGLLALAACGWLFWRTAGVFRALAASATRHPLDAGLVAAAIAICVHGLFDSFLSFTATYVAMAIVLGLAVARHELQIRHAHRI